MMKGNILYAVSNGHYILRFIGDIRVNLCGTINEFFNCIFKVSSLKSIIIDLSEAQGIDSTSLGLLAKISVKSRQLLNRKAIIISKNPDISCILYSMGFDQVFEIYEDNQDASYKDDLECQYLTTQSSKKPEVHSDQVYDFVLEAHRYLIEMNEKNRETFKPLVDALELEKSQAKQLRINAQGINTQGINAQEQGMIHSNNLQSEKRPNYSKSDFAVN